MRLNTISGTFSLSLLALFSAGCQATQSAGDITPQQEASITFATWNVEHLASPISAGCRPRTAEEIDALKTYARSIDADIVGLQEIGSTEAASLIFPADEWNIIMSERPDSDAYECRGSGFMSTQQKVAYAVRKTIPVTQVRSLDDFGLDSPGLRHGLEITVDTPFGEVSALNVHMKSGCFVDNYSRADSDACQTFARQAPILDAWIEDKEARGAKYVVLGDFNHRLSAPYNHLTRQLTDNQNGSASSLVITTKDIIGCHPWYPAPIDHLLMGGIDTNSVDATVDVFAFEDMNVDNMLSDHCAISLSLTAKQLPLTNAVKWQTTSKEYQYLTTKTYSQAQDALANKALPEGRWTVVLDVDETVLDNSQYQVELDKSGQRYTPTSWAKWVEREAAPLVPGVKPFLEDVLRLGGTLSLVTNRDQSLDRHTWQNLLALGLPLTDANTCLIGRVDADKAAIDHATLFNDKDLRRHQITQGTASCYSPSGTRKTDFPASKIIMQIGDNIEDFSGVTQEEADIGQLLELHADEYFLLPNPMYGSW